MYNESYFVFIFSIINNKQNSKTWWKRHSTISRCCKNSAILLFADDIILIGATEKNNVLGPIANCIKSEAYCKYGKIKIIVFQKGGPPAAQEKWFIGNKQLLVVNQYCYLGLIFSSSLSSNLMLSNLAIEGALNL